MTTVAILIVADVVRAADSFQSSLQPGEKITTIFEPLNVNGEHANEPYCLICENGLAPVVMVFAREPDSRVMRLIARLDEATQANKAKNLGSFVVFLSDKPGLQEELAAAAKKNGLKHTILAIDPPAGPEGFKVAPQADLTVILYRNHEVKANHAFQRGEFTDDAHDRILRDLPKILTP